MPDELDAVAAELIAVATEYKALAQKPWPDRRMAKAEIAERMAGDLRELRRLRDRIVELRRQLNARESPPLQPR